MEPKYQGLGETPCRTEVELPTWITTEIRWRRQVKTWGSPGADFSFLPRSQRKHMESGLTTLQVSTGIGWNWYARSGWADVLVFSVSACAAAPSASLAVAWRWKSQKVSTQVASHTKNLPFDQGTMVTPSGQLPSALYKPDGSSLLGMFADANERWMTLFRIWWCEALPWLDLQLKPWRPHL